jgi:hypothetical protein
MPQYRLAHPLDEGNRFLKRAAAAAAGDVVELHPSHAAKLGEAGYLNLDGAGKPLVVTAVSKPDAKSAKGKAKGKGKQSKPDVVDEPDGDQPAVGDEPDGDEPDGDQPDAE